MAAAAGTVKERGRYMLLDATHTDSATTDNAFRYRHLDETHRPTRGGDTDLPARDRHLSSPHVCGADSL